MDLINDICDQWGEVTSLVISRVKSEVRNTAGFHAEEIRKVFDTEKAKWSGQSGYRSIWLTRAETLRKGFASGWLQLLAGMKLPGPDPIRIPSKKPYWILLVIVCAILVGGIFCTPLLLWKKIIAVFLGMAASYSCMNLLFERKRDHAMRRLTSMYSGYLEACLKQLIDYARGFERS